MARAEAMTGERLPAGRRIATFTTFGGSVQQLYIMGDGRFTHSGRFERASPSSIVPNRLSRFGQRVLRNTTLFAIGGSAYAQRDAAVHSGDEGHRDSGIRQSVHRRLLQVSL